MQIYILTANSRNIPSIQQSDILDHIDHTSRFTGRVKQGCFVPHYITLQCIRGFSDTSIYSLLTTNNQKKTNKNLKFIVLLMQRHLKTDIRNSTSSIGRNNYIRKSYKSQVESHESAWFRMHSYIVYTSQCLQSLDVQEFK